MQIVGTGSIVIDGIALAVILSTIPLIAAFVVGFIMSVLQAATQIQEQTLSFIPKLVAVVTVLIVLGPWMGQELVDYMSSILAQVKKGHI